MRFLNLDKGRLKVVDGDFRQPLFSSLQCRADSNKTPPSRHTHARARGNDGRVRIKKRVDQPYCIVD